MYRSCVTCGGGQQVIKWFEDARTAWNEPMVKIDEAQELTKLAERPGRWEIVYGFHLVREWMNTLAVDPVTQEIQFRDSQDALGWVDIDSVLTEALKN